MHLGTRADVLFIVDVRVCISSRKSTGDCHTERYKQLHKLEFNLEPWKDIKAVLVFSFLGRATCRILSRTDSRHWNDPMELGITVPEAFHSLSCIPVQLSLDDIDQLKALFISKSYHVIICISICGKHNRLAAGEVNMIVEGKT